MNNKARVARIRDTVLRILPVWMSLLALSATPPAEAAREEGACGRLVMVMPDLSGSFSAHLPAAVSEIRRLLLGLGPGDCFLARGISGDSFGVSNDIVQLERLPMPRRTIDAAHRTEIVLRKRRIVERLDGILQLKPASRTDIWQSLYSASVTLQNLSARQRDLYLFTDLDDNRNLRPHGLPLRLDGVTARLVVPRRNQDTFESFQARIKIWTERLIKAGAAVAFNELQAVPSNARPSTPSTRIRKGGN